MESTRSRRSLIIILALVIIAALALLAAVISNRNNLSNTPNQNNTQTEAKSYCEGNSSTWIEEAKECEGLSEAMCESEGGVFNDCASACRNNPEQDICTLQCVQVCDFDMNPEVTVQVLNGDNVMELSQEPVDNENAFDFMTRLAEENSEFTFEYSESSFGKFVTSVNGIEADSTSQFWELIVNGTPAAVGISDLTLKAGDVVEWKLTEFSTDFQ